MTRVEEIDDLDTAKQLLKLYIKEHARQQARIEDLLRQIAIAKGTPESEQLQLQLDEVREQLAAFQRKVFGDSSEKRASGKPAATAKEPQRGHGPRKQEELLAQKVVCELDDDERMCPACGERLEEMAGQTEDSELIANVLAEYRKLLVMRQKYRCRCNGAVVTAPGPRRLQKGGRYSVSFAVQVAIDKYVDHLPLERQVRIMARAGLLIDSQTLWDQIDELGNILEPHYDALREYILGADVIGADETWWRLMAGKSSKRWWAWGITTHDAAWYTIAKSRSAEVAAEVLEGFEGTVLCDGYKAYSTVERKCPGIRLAHCWSHARRNFVEAEGNYPVACNEALSMIGELFAIESTLPKPGDLAGDAKTEALQLRLRVRQEKSKPVLEKLRAWALTQRGLPKGGLRKAIDYMLQYWNGLIAFVDDPYLEIHNNGTERALRGMVIGRKNHHGSRSERGTKVAAILYSLVESAKLAGVDPALYLRRAVEAVLDDPSNIILPHQLA